MRTKYKTTIKFSFALAIAIIFSGCAALTLDVDVYKGSLSNHKDVLAEQTSVMATGAKPILINLRNTLEYKCLQDNDKLKEKNLSTYTLKTRLKPDLSLMTAHDFKSYDKIHAGVLGQPYKFCSPPALNVNSILSLYDNRRENEFAPLAQAGKDALREYKISKALLNPENNNQTNNSWKDYKKGFKPEILKEAKTPEQHLALAIKTFLAPPISKEGFRSIPCIFLSHQKIKEAHPGSSLPKIRDILDAKYIKLHESSYNTCEPIYNEKPPKEARWASSTSMFLVLENNRDIINEYANIIFKVDELERKNKFVNQVQKVAKSFSDTRNAVRNLLKTSLYFIIKLSSPPYKDNVKYSQYRNDAIDSVKELIKVKYLTQALFFEEIDKKSKEQFQELREALKIAKKVKATSPASKETTPASNNIDDEKDDYPEYIFTDEKPTEDPPKPIEETPKKDKENLPTVQPDVMLGDLPTAQTKVAQEAITETTQKPTTKKSTTKTRRSIKIGKDDTEDSKKFKRLLQSELIIHPEQTARTLLKADRYYAVFGEDEVGHRSSRFGISEGPDKSRPGMSKAVKIPQELGDALTSGGLERGRLTEGLDELIETYLKATKNRSDPDARDNARKELFDSLVRFAQKVLFIANNQTLFEQSCSKAPYFDEETCATTAYIEPVSTASKRSANVDKYIQVLQAVGNSILYQVDELRHQETYDENLEKNGDLEAHALKQTLPKYSELVLIKLIEGLEKDFAQSKSKFGVYNSLENAQQAIQGAATALLKAKTANTKATKEEAEAKPIRDEWKKINDFIQRKSLEVLNQDPRTISISLINPPKGLKIDSERKKHVHTLTNSQPIVFFTKKKSSGLETESSIPIEVALSKSTKNSVTAEVILTDNSGRASLHQEKVIINPGESSKTFYLHIKPNENVDSDEPVKISLAKPIGAQLDPNWGIVYEHTIKDDDGPPILEFETSDSYKLEDNNQVNFAIKLSKPLSENLTVQYSVTPGSGTEEGKGKDFNFTSIKKEVDIIAGKEEATITANIKDNGVHDNINKSFEITLIKPKDVILQGKTKHTHHIIDKDGKPTVYFGKQNTTIDESAGTISIPVKLSNWNNEEVKVDYIVEAIPGSTNPAKEGEDFKLKNGTLSFTGSTDTLKEIPVKVISNDKLDGDRKFQIRLTKISAGNADISLINSNTVTISDDDKPFPILGFERKFSQSNEDSTSHTVGVILNRKTTQEIQQPYEIIDSEKDGSTIGQLKIPNDGDKGTITINTSEIEPKNIWKARLISFNELKKAFSEKLSSLKDGEKIDEKFIKEFDELTVPEANEKKSRDKTIKSIEDATIAKFGTIEKDYNEKTKALKNAGDTLTKAEKTHKLIEEKFEAFQDALKKKNAAEVTRSNKIEFIKFLNERSLETDKPEVVQGQVVQFLKQKLSGISAPPPPSLPTIEFEKTSSRNLEKETTPTVNVKLSKASEISVTVKYKAKGPAINGAGKDFELKEDVLLFQKGETSKTIPGLKVIDDSKDNEDRTFVLEISEATGAKLGGNKEHVYRIIDDDKVPSVYFETVKSEGKEDLTPAKIKVQISNVPESGNAEVDFKVIKGTGNQATKDTDFILADATLVFDKSKNETEKYIDIVIINDTEKESNEEIVLELSNPKNSKLSGDHRKHIFTIKANDGGEISAATVMASAKIKNDEKKKLNDAIERVQVRLPQMEYPIPATRVARQGRDSELNTKEVMDQLIKTLKYEHINAVREGGESSGAVKQLEEALSAAYEHRAGMVAIRPAFAYLRNSFPSTSLQDDADLGWKNLLRSRVLRGLFGECLDCEEKNRRRINKEIDKQYWQNINRIRVSGGGDTNYVLAKDDIGNWTVKNYSADPKDIIKSAKNLAMFNIGQSMGTNLSGYSTPPTIPGADGTPATTNEPTQNQTRLEASYEKFEKDYSEQAKKDLNALQAQLASIPDNLENLWEKTEDKDKSILLGSLKNSKEKYLDPRLAATLDKNEPGNDIILSLHSLELFGDDLINRLNAVPKTTASQPKEAEDSQKGDKPEKSNPAMDQAIKEVNVEVRDYIVEFVEKRLIAVQNFEMAVAVFSDTISN